MIVVATLLVVAAAAGGIAAAGWVVSVVQDTPDIQDLKARPQGAVSTVYAADGTRLHAVLAGKPVDLLETLCQRLADVCLSDPLVEAVEITLHKPQAELGVPFDDVTVSIRRER